MDLQPTRSHVGTPCDGSGACNHLGELYDMSDAPFSEKFVEADAVDLAAVTARSRLAAVLAKLNPAGGILDTGDGTGRHANKDTKKGVDERDKPVTSPESTVSEKSQPTQSNVRRNSTNWIKKRSANSPVTFSRPINPMPKRRGTLRQLR